ncbi:hypothetical protein BIT18_2083, partial [Mycobacterium tuberculosis variant bovis]
MAGLAGAARAAAHAGIAVGGFPVAARAALTACAAGATRAARSSGTNATVAA